MRKIFLFMLISATFYSNLQAQTYHKVGTYSFGTHQLLLNMNDLETAFDRFLAPVLDVQYSFDTAMLDDPYPNNLDSVSYLIIKANATESESGTITLGIRLTKQFSQQSEGDVDLFVGDSTAYRMMEEDAGWKCTSTSSQCGGCVKIKLNGVVVACHCYVNQSMYCNFETSGGGGSNFPPWIIALIQLLLSLA